MPCGLVYSVLLVAAASGSALDGAATLLAFGAGTLPAMTGLTLGGAAVAQGLRRPAFRRTAGALVVTAAAWTLLAAFVHPPGAAHPHAHHVGAPEPFASRYPNP